jgi:uroporphyrinogen III methyltransferase/synthase
VVRLRDQLAWFERRALWGLRLLVTRAAAKADFLAQRLEDLGAVAERLPAIELAPMPRSGRLAQAIRNLPQTDWVFFTSPEGIGWLSHALRGYRKDLRVLAGCAIAAIGTKTAQAIEDRGIHVDFVPKRFNQEGVLDDWPRHSGAGKRAVIFCAEQSRDVLADGLREREMSVEKIAVYRTRIPSGLPAEVKRVFEQPFDYVTVTSASCVEHLYRSLAAAGLSRQFKTLSFASIGPVTSQTVREHGAKVALEAWPSTAEGLIAALVARHGKAAPEKPLARKAEAHLSLAYAGDEGPE